MARAPGPEIQENAVLRLLGADVARFRHPRRAFGPVLGLVVAGLTLAGPAAAATTLVQGPGDTVLGFGHSVADAGDVNGDGFGDLIVGAPFDNTGGTARGRAFLWFGGPNMRVQPDVILTGGETAFDWFGWSVAGIGDVDDDGFADVAVGGPGDDDAGEKAGAVWVYYGGPNFAGNVFDKFTGEQGGDRFGWSVSKAGDMDRDGIDDFVVGAPYADGPVTDSGRAYLFLGDRSSIPATAARVWDGPAVGGPQSSTDFGEFAPDGASFAIQGPGFGWSVADVPNFRGDNRAAVAVGAPGAVGAQGRAYLYFAASTAGQLPSATANVTFTNDVADQQFGWSVSSGAFIGSSTRNDLLVGAPGAIGDTGFVRVFYGALNPAATISTANLQRNGGTSGDRFGAVVADVGDHDGDGKDWIVGAPERDDGGLQAGWVYWYDGTASTPTNVRAVNLTGSAEAGDHWGFAVSSAGDLDGDGLDDFFVGAPDANNLAGAVRGNVAIVGSGSGVVSTPTVRLYATPGTDGSTNLFFEGSILARAQSVELWSTGNDARLLAELDDGIVRMPEGLQVTLDAGFDGESVELTWTIDGITSRQEFGVPKATPRLVLHAAVPNPFNPSTRLSFVAPVGVPYELSVIDARGRFLRTLDAGIGTGGTLERVFDGRDGEGRFLASGVYYVQLRANERTEQQQVVLLK